ncbi:MAG: WD40 repeat domain-containing protein, partial [Burkholderiales bacterium]
TFERVELRRTDGGREVTTITDGAISAAISPDAKTVLTGSQDGKAELWSTEGGAAIATFVGHKGQVRSVAFSPNGRTVLTGSGDGTAKVWRQEGGDAITTFVAHQVESYNYISIDSVAFSPDGRFVLTGSSNGLTELWPAEGGDLLETFEINGSDVTSVAFSPDGATVLTGSSDKTARLWPIDPVLLAAPAEQMRIACIRLKDIGVTALSEADLVRFPIVDRHTPHPCAKIWAGR